MISERYQVSAVPVDPMDSETVTGFVTGVMPEIDMAFIRPIDHPKRADAVGVHYHTIEPVRVRPILIDLQYHCPDDDCGEKLHRWWDFCPLCGMALDWGE